MKKRKSKRQKVVEKTFDKVVDEIARRLFYGKKAKLKRATWK